MLLQFTCSRTSKLPSISCAAAVVVSFYHDPSSVSLFARFFFAISLSAFRQPKVEYSWIEVCRIPSFVSSLPVPTAERFRIFPFAGPLPLKLS